MSLADGSKMRLEFDGKQIFHETKVSIGGDKEFKETATKDASSISLPGKKTTSISVEGVMSHADPGTKAAVEDIINAWNNDTLAVFKVTDSETGHTEFSGNAYIQNWNVDATNDEFITFSYTLKTDGDLTVGTVA